MLYTSPPGRFVHSNTISTSLGSIQPWCNYYAKSIRSHINNCLWPGTELLLSELRQCGVNEIAKASKWQQDDSNSGESGTFLVLFTSMDVVINNGQLCLCYAVPHTTAPHITMPHTARPHCRAPHHCALTY